VEDRRAPLRGRPDPRPGPRRAVHPPRRPRAELLDHRHAGRGLVPRRSVLGHRRRRCRTEIGSIDNVEPFIASVKSGEGGRLQGFGHRVYKSYDPRATIIKRTADDVFSVTGKNPLLDIALKLEEIALSDDYFISRKLYPNVDFYSGLIYQAMGFPLEMFPVLFAIPRTAGWLAHWQEMLNQDSKIVRPRQLYIGADERDYRPIGER
jgi:citrate synthase